MSNLTYRLVTGTISIAGAAAFAYTDHGLCAAALIVLAFCCY